MPRPASLFAAVTAHEIASFLPEPLGSRLRSLPSRHESCDTANLSPAEFHRLLAAANPEVLVTCWRTPPLPAQLPSNLRYVCHLAGSIKHLIAREHIAAGLLVTNWGGSISRIVAECALFHILSALRRATHWTQVMHREGGWKSDRIETASLFGRRVGLHGFGLVARELIKLLAPFGCPIAAFAPDVDAATAARFGIRHAPSLEELFSGNDIVVEIAPLIPATIGSVTEKHLRLLPPGGVFVNVGRGAVVDEAGLVRVAREGRIHLGLDVFPVEPLPADSSLRGLANVSLTPHIGGPTTDRRRDAGEFALGNLQAYAEDRPLQAVITTQVFDTST